MAKDEDLFGKKESLTTVSPTKTTSYVPIGFIDMNPSSSTNEVHSNSLYYPNYPMPLPHHPTNVSSGSNEIQFASHSRQEPSLPSYSLPAANELNIVSFISVESPKLVENDNIASAPTVEDIDHKIGLTAVERNELIGAFSKMKNNVYEKKGSSKANFIAAQNKINEILSEADSRLTDKEYEEFLLKWKEIRNARSNFIKIQVKKDRVKQQRKKKREQVVEPALSVSMKILQLSLIFSFIYQGGPYYFAEHLLILSLNIFSITFTVYSMFPYYTSELKNRCSFATICIGSLIFACGYLKFGIVTYEWKTCSIAALYFIEMGLSFSIILTRDFSQNVSHSDLSLPSSSTQMKYLCEASAIRNTSSLHYSSGRDRFYQCDYSTNNEVIESINLPAGVDNCLSSNLLSSSLLGGTGDSNQDYSYGGACEVGDSGGGNCDYGTGGDYGGGDNDY